MHNKVDPKKDYIHIHEVKCKIYRDRCIYIENKIKN
jgi:hypothetical protein